MFRSHPSSDTDVRRSIFGSPHVPPSTREKLSTALNSHRERTKDGRALLGSTIIDRDIRTHRGPFDIEYPKIGFVEKKPCVRLEEAVRALHGLEESRVPIDIHHGIMEELCDFVHYGRSTVVCPGRADEIEQKKSESTDYSDSSSWSIHLFNEDRRPSSFLAHPAMSSVMFLS